MLIVSRIILINLLIKRSLTIFLTISVPQIWKIRFIAGKVFIRAFSREISRIPPPPKKNWLGHALDTLGVKNVKAPSKCTANILFNIDTYLKTTRKISPFLNLGTVHLSFFWFGRFFWERVGAGGDWKVRERMWLTNSLGLVRYKLSCSR